ncbi:MAG: ankyrin repeat domain-containing protein [Ottowia sp.]|uniref:ankyrin repeat domain-containing protein n=1 Tax=unclassified Ottowia TaxID=2645081 RepID=UPI003C2C60C4
MQLSQTIAPHYATSPTAPSSAQPLSNALPAPLLYAGAPSFPLDRPGNGPTCSHDMDVAVADAIQRWDLDKLLGLMQEGADTLQAGPAALKMAAQENNLAQVRHLIKVLQHAGVDLNTLDPHGDTALAVAARDGHQDVVAALTDALLQSGGDINATNNQGFTPLSEAAYKGHREAASVLINALVQSGGDLNTANEYGFTPLTRAAYMGHWEVVYMLADALQQTGGDINVSTPGCGGALTLALEQDHLDAADRLLQTGALAEDEHIQDIVRSLGFDHVGADALQSARERSFPGIAQALAARIP